MVLSLWRIEDGFLRSVGLGADLKKPCSLTLDDSGMYYDPRQASGLENSLNTHEFTSSELDVGQKIINELKRNSLSKYNVGSQKSLNWRHSLRDKDRRSRCRVVRGRPVL
jgi:capsular polysaccharide export protein